MSKHTPGPWTVQKSGSFGWSIRGNWHGDISKLAYVDAGICEIRGKFFDEQKANAALMAAAPELAVALRALLDWGRKHTSPRDTNTPHALLVAAADVLAKAGV
jgi:hypothetical protein